MKWEQVEDVGCGGEVKKEFTEIFASKGFWGTVPAIHAVTNSPRPNITAQYYATSKTPQSVTAQFRRPLRQDFADLSVETSPTSSSRFRRPLRRDSADLFVRTSPTSPSILRRPLRQDLADHSIKVSPTTSPNVRRPRYQNVARGLRQYNDSVPHHMKNFINHLLFLTLAPRDYVTYYQARGLSVHTSPCGECVWLVSW